MNFSEFKEHFPKKISKAIVRYVTDTVLRNSRYLFIQSVVNVQFAHCTHCNQRHRPDIKLKHKQKELAICPHCKSKCFVRAAGISRKFMEDRAVFVWYEKSLLNSKAITARVISVYRDYSGDFKDVQTVYSASHMYLFEPGQSYYFWGLAPCKSVYSAFDRYYGGFSRVSRYMSLSNIRNAVKGTPFQYSTWEQYTKFKNPKYVSDMTKFFDLAARYPCIEYLTKSGFQEMVWAKLYNEPTHGAINWNGKTMEKVTRLSKNELREIRESGLTFTPHQLFFYQQQRKKGMSFSLSESYVLADVSEGFASDYYKIALTLAPEHTILKYLLKQFNKGNFLSITYLIIDWRDYRKQCQELGINLREEKNLFPNDLYAIHQKLALRIKKINDRSLNNRIRARLSELEKYKFEWNGLFIKPAESSNELLEEGKALEHCVSNYASDYSTGKTIIFLIRRTDEPDKPFYTMESDGSNIVQCRGFKNCAMAPEVRQFVNQFINKKLLTKKRSRIDVTGIRQEVAI